MLRRVKARSGEEGFSLIELLVVLVIMALLATVVIINVLPEQDKAMTQKARADIAQLEQALEMYRLDNLSYPSTADGLQALVTQPAGLTNGAKYRPGGYIKRLPQDPWGRDYYYAAPSSGGQLNIYSLGADGVEGGEGPDADINSKDL